MHPASFHPRLAPLPIPYYGQAKYGQAGEGMGRDGYPVGVVRALLNIILKKLKKFLT